jgi:hypothetical protein
MKLVDDIDNDVIENPADEKESKLFYAMLNGQTVSDTIATSRGDFVVKFPKQRDLITIGLLTATRRGGIPAAQFDAVANYELERCAYMDMTVESGPAWFENAKKKNPDFTWSDIPDTNFSDEIFAKCLSFRQKVQAFLNGGKQNTDKGTAETVSGGVPPDVGGGVFSGVAGSTEGT